MPKFNITVTERYEIEAESIEEARKIWYEGHDHDETFELTLRDGEVIFEPQDV